MTKRVVLVLLAVLWLSGDGSGLRAESASGLVEEGNRLFNERRFKEALERYQRAQQLEPSSPGVHYNLGNALYQLGQYDKAYDELRQAFAARERELAGGARYNAGNSHLARRNWQEAIRNYQEALRLQPADRDAKKNLELALRQLEEERKKRQQEQQKNQQGPPPPPEGQPPPSGNQGEEDQEKDQQGRGQQSPEQRSPRPRPSRQEKLSREEALRLLNAVRSQDKGEDMLLAPPPDRRSEKDW